MNGKTVLVLPGLGDARVLADGMVKYLHDQGGYMAECVA
jgi:hypothetical protein